MIRRITLAFCMVSIAGCSPDELPSAEQQMQQKRQIQQQEQAEQAREILFTLPEVTHKAIVKTTRGKIELDLFGNDAPLAVENMVKLAKKRFYDRIYFHRLARDFVLQTGDPKARTKAKIDEWGTGGESAFGAPFPDELDSLTTAYQLGYKRGVVAMANGAPNENNSQFFICLRDIPELRKNFTIFGIVSNGMEVIDSIAKSTIEPVLDSTDGRPIPLVRIVSLRIKKVKAEK